MHLTSRKGAKFAEVPGHVGRPERTLGLARAQDEDRLAAAAHDLADELVRRLDFEPLGTPAELEPRRRIALADQVHPERILDLRRQLVAARWAAPAPGPL